MPAGRRQRVRPARDGGTPSATASRTRRYAARWATHRSRADPSCGAGSASRQRPTAYRAHSCCRSSDAPSATTKPVGCSSALRVPSSRQRHGPGASTGSQPGARRTPGPRRTEAHARGPGRGATLEVGQQSPHGVAPGADVEAACHERHEVPRAEPDAGRLRRGEVAVEPERLGDLDEVEDAPEIRGDQQLGLDGVNEQHWRLRRLAVGARGCRRARRRLSVRADDVVFTTRAGGRSRTGGALRPSGAPGRSGAPRSTVGSTSRTSPSSLALSPVDRDGWPAAGHRRPVGRRGRPGGGASPPAVAALPGPPAPGRPRPGRPERAPPG